MFKDVSIILAEDFHHCTEFEGKIMAKVVAVKLGDLRKTDGYGVKDFKEFAQRTPFATELVLRHIDTLEKKHSDKALTRIGVTDEYKKAVTTTNIFHFPELPCVNMRQVMMEMLRRELSFMTQPCAVTAIKLIGKKARSIKDVMVNTRKWGKSLDSERFPCTCSSLRTILGIADDGQGHVCVPSAATSFVKTVSASVAVSTKVVWSRRSAWEVIEKKIMEFNKNRRKRDIVGNLDFAVFRDLLHFCYQSNGEFQHLGVREQDLVQWKQLLDHRCVVSIIDKDKSQLCFQCPAFYQDRCAELCLGSPHLSKDSLDLKVILKRFQHVQKMLAYTGSRMHPVEKHRFGCWDAWPKASGLRTKMRPTGSHARHCMRGVYTLTSRVMDYMVKKTWECPIAVNSFSLVCKSIAEFNLDSQENLRRGFKPHSDISKYDIDNFFGNVSRTLVWDSLAYLTLHFVRKFGRRRMVVCIPVRKAWRESQVSKTKFTRSFGLLLRNMANVSGPIPRLQSAKVDSATHNVMHVDDIKVAILLEFETGMLWYGMRAVRWDDGTTQGSSLSPAMCGMVCAVLEVSNSKRFMKHYGIFTNMLVRRWVDDILIAITVWMVNMDHDAASVIVNNLRGETLRPFKRHFHMKDECADEFVGMRIVLGGAMFSLQPRCSVSLVDPMVSCKPKFQHYVSNVARYERLAMVLGMMYQTVDRSVGQEACVVAIAKLILEFRHLGYPMTILWIAMSRMLSRHPYLVEVRKGFHRAMLVQEVWYNADRR